MFFLKRCDVCIKTGFNGNAYCVERTSLAGKIVEASAPAGVLFSLRNLTSLLTFRMAGLPMEALWLCSPCTRKSWPSCVNVETFAYNVCIFFIKRCIVCIKFGLDGNIYWVERTSVTGKIAEYTAAAGTRSSLRTLIFFIHFCVAGLPIEALWLCSPCTRISWPSCVKAETRHCNFDILSNSRQWWTDLFF